MWSSLAQIKVWFAMSATETLLNLTTALNVNSMQYMIVNTIFGYE